MLGLRVCTLLEEKGSNEWYNFLIISLVPIHRTFALMILRIQVLSQLGNVLVGSSFSFHWSLNLSFLPPTPIPPSRMLIQLFYNKLIDLVPCLPECKRLYSLYTLYNIRQSSIRKYMILSKNFIYEDNQYCCLYSRITCNFTFCGVSPTVNLGSKIWNAKFQK